MTGRRRSRATSCYACPESARSPAISGGRKRKAGYPREWRGAADDSEYLSYVTAEELTQVKKELHAVLVRFRERLQDPAKRPPGALPVETLLLSYPIEPLRDDSGAEPHAGEDG